MSAARYRKRPGYVEAMQWDGSEESQRTIVNWARMRVSGWFDRSYFLAVQTLHGETRADPGDWVIRGANGDYWPCKPDVFAATYEPVETPTSGSAATGKGSQPSLSEEKPA